MYIAQFTQETNQLLRSQYPNKEISTSVNMATSFRYPDDRWSNLRETFYKKLPEYFGSMKDYYLQIKIPGICSLEK